MRLTSSQIVEYFRVAMKTVLSCYMESPSSLNNKHNMNYGLKSPQGEG